MEFRKVPLYGNAIESPNEAAFASLESLHQITLSDNPIRCDCELRWFPTFRSSLRSLNMIGSCDTPAELNGVSLEHLMEDQLLCNCTPACMNGTCNMTVGECECDDGYVGNTCDTSCSPGSFGEGCSQNCTCVSQRESSPCDHVNGTCYCLPGYTGPSCENTSEPVTSSEVTPKTSEVTSEPLTTVIMTSATLPASNIGVPVYGIALLTLSFLVLVVVLAMPLVLALITSKSKRHTRQVGVLSEFSLSEKQQHYEPKET